MSIFFPFENGTDSPQSAEAWDNGSGRRMLRCLFSKFLSCSRTLHKDQVCMRHREGVRPDMYKFAEGSSTYTIRTIDGVSPQEWHD